MNYQDVLKQKENNITRIDEIIKFLIENFDGLDKYNSKYGQLVGLLNKERRLYSNLDKSDPDVFYNELREIKRQISFKILEIKYELSKAFEEKTFEFKALKVKLCGQCLKELLIKKIKANIHNKICKILDEILDKDINKESNKIKKLLEECFIRANGDPLLKEILDLMNKKERSDEEVKSFRENISEIKNQLKNTSEEKDSRTKETSCEQYIKDINKKTKEISKLASEYFKYYLTNSFEERSVKDYFNALLKFHPLILSGISLVGMIYYFAYFGFELRYFPDLGGSDVAYVGVLFFFILAFISLSIILPCLFYPGYHKKDVVWIFFFWLSLLPLFTLVCMATLNTIINKSLDVLFLSSLIGSFLYLSIVIYIDKITTYSLYKAIAIIITIVVFLVIIFVKLNLLFFLSMAGFYLMTLVYFKGFKYFYNNNDFLQFAVAFIIVVFAISSWFVTNEFANKLGIANVEYKYLSIEKSALGALPKGICDITNINLAEENLTILYADNKLTIKDENNNSALCGNVFPEYIKFSCEDNEFKNIKEATNIKYQNRNLSYAIVDKNTLKENNFTIGTTAKVTPKENITYIEKQNDVILLHNIKAISTLGKFYYLETIGYKNENNEETKFELDSSKIISRAKE